MASDESALASSANEPQELDVPLQIDNGHAKHRGIQLQHRPRGQLSANLDAEASEIANDSSDDLNVIEVRVPGPKRPWEYQTIEEDNTVDSVLSEFHRHGNEVWYRVIFADDREEDVGQSRPSI